MKREYECKLDGAFLVNRPISASTTEVCPKCGTIAKQIFTKFPQYGFKGNGIPNDSKDSVEYEQWQRNEWRKWEDKLHIDNAGADKVETKKLLKRTDL